MASKKNKPSCPKESQLEVADRFLVQAYKEYSEYESVAADDLTYRIHGVHDKLLLSMRPLGSGQRIYSQDFNTDEPRPTIADTYCHLMAPAVVKDLHLACLASLYALKLVEDLAASNRLDLLQRTLDCIRYVFLDLLHHHNTLLRIAENYVFTTPYLSRINMCVLWIALVLDTPQELFLRILNVIDNEVYEEEPEEDSGDPADDEVDSGEEKAAGEGSPSEGDSEADPDEDWTGTPWDSQDELYRDLICPFLLRQIDELEADSGKRFMRVSFESDSAEGVSDEFLQDNVLLMKQMLVNRPCSKHFTDFLGKSKRTARLNLVFLRNTHTFTNMQLRKLLPDRDVANLRQTCLDRMGEHLRRILNFLQDNQLYQQGSAIGAQEASPIVSQYWSRKNAVRTLPSSSDIPEPLSDSHTEVPLFAEIDQRIQRSLTRKMLRGPDEFFGKFQEEDVLTIAAGLWELSCLDSLWIDNYLASNLIKAVLSCSPYRSLWLRQTTGTQAISHEPPEDFLNRIRPLLDNILYPNYASSRQIGTAAFSFNDMLHSVGFHYIDYEQLHLRRSIERRLWHILGYCLPQSDLLLGAAVMQLMLDDAEEEAMCRMLDANWIFTGFCFHAWVEDWFDNNLPGKKDDLF